MTNSTSLTPPRVALVFPGQGAIHSRATALGFGGGSVCPPATETPEGRAVFRRTEEFLGLDLLQACRTSATTRLSDLYVSQVAQVVVNVAAAHALFARHPHVFNTKRTQHHGALPSAAGLSLGEVAAMTATGHLSLEDGLRVTHERAKVFERLSSGQLASAKPQGMCVVQGLERAEVETLCLLARSRAGATDDDELACSVGIDLFPRAVTVGGHRAALDVFVELAKTAGAHKVRVLHENAAGHTTAIARAAREFRASIKRAGAAFRTPSPASFGGMVYSNLTASVFKPDEWEASEYFYLQNISTVRWQDQIRAMAKQGYRFVDMGPGDSVTTTLRKIPGVTPESIIPLEDAYAPGGDALLWPEGAKPRSNALCSFAYDGRTWSIHLADMSDARNLLEVQDSAWSSAFHISEKALRTIIRKYPELQTVLISHDNEGGSEFAGYVICQRVRDPMHLLQINCRTYDTIGDTAGRFVFPFSINVKPQFTGTGVASLLWDLSIWYWSTLDLDGHCGITRLHHGYPREVSEASESAADATACLFRHVLAQRTKDPIIKFHTVHGAEMMQIVPRYRPDDASNLTHGVMMSLTNRISRLRTLAQCEHSGCLQPLSCIRNAIPAPRTAPAQPLDQTPVLAEALGGPPSSTKEKLILCLRSLGYNIAATDVDQPLHLASMEHFALAEAVQRALSIGKVSPTALLNIRSVNGLASYVASLRGGHDGGNDGAFSKGLSEPALDVRVASDTRAMLHRCLVSLGYSIHSTDDAHPIHLASMEHFAMAKSLSASLGVQVDPPRLLECRTLGSMCTYVEELKGSVSYDPEPMHLSENSRRAGPIKTIELSRAEVGMEQKYKVSLARTACTFFRLHVSRLFRRPHLVMSGEGLHAVPAVLGELTHLRSLDLSKQNITGLDTCTLSKLVLLTRLELSALSMHSMPADCIAPALKVLKVNRNQLASLPSGMLERLTDLRWFELGHNVITSVPSTVGLATRMFGLRMSFNCISSLPHELFGLSGLRSLHCASNSLTLPIVCRDDRLYSLRDLDIQANWSSGLHLKGGSLSSLEGLSISHNRLDHVDLSACTSLRSLEGEIASKDPLETFSSLTSSSLIKLALKGNACQALRTKCSLMSSVFSLDISANRITSLPEDIDLMVSLRQLVVGKNRLACLPLATQALTRIAYFDFHANQLTAIVFEMNQLTAMDNLCASDNLLTSFPHIGRLHLLRDLVLCRNSFEQLQSFNLSDHPKLEFVNADVETGIASPSQGVEFISFGNACNPALDLESHGLRTVPYPFDYVESTMDGLKAEFASDFAAFLDMRWEEGWWINVHGFRFLHDDFVSGENGSRPQYERSIKRLYHTLSTGSDVRLVRYVQISKKSVAEIIGLHELVLCLRMKFQNEHISGCVWLHDHLGLLDPCNFHGVYSILALVGKAGIAQPHLNFHTGSSVLSVWFGKLRELLLG